MIDYPGQFLIKGRTAFVTGGMGLLGREICQALATAGGKTVILDIDARNAEIMVSELADAGCDIHFEHFDVTDLEHVDANIERLGDKYGTLDIWVNSAYPRTADWGAKVEELSLDSWRRNVDMNLNSYAWISRRVAMIMKDRGGGSIINLSSIYGIVGNDFSVYEGTEMTGPMAYSAIKAGIVNLTRYMASYFGKYNVRVNSVCPGGIRDKQNDIFINNYESKTPLKRMGEPREIASTVLFLASEASSYITGAAILVDGGWTAI